MENNVFWQEALERLAFGAGILAWLFCIIFATYRMNRTSIRPFVRGLVFLGITALFIGIVFLVVKL